MTDVPICRTIDEIRRAVSAARRDGQRVGFVPTMGALHAGHARLIDVARQECGFVVVSIFVNPAQFGPNEDFGRYPRSFDADRELCAQNGADAIFAPDAAAIYPPGFHTYVEVEQLQDALCGASRPGHFRGVCTVVLKLFHIVQPDVAYFGQKDAQQALIIQRMVRDLDVPVAIRTVATVRELDGLALSSRNRYLSPEERAQAPALYRSLEYARRLIEAGERDPGRIEQQLHADLDRVPGIRIDYAQVVSAETLQPVVKLSGPILIAVAAYLGNTRLIDNLQVELPVQSS